MWLLPVHWTHRFRRTVICPGAECPACQSERPKHRGYLVGRYKQHERTSDPGLIEIGQLIVSDLERLGFTDHERAAGWTWEQEPGQDGLPRVTRASVTPTETGQVFTSAAIALGLEDLYQLEPTFGDVTDCGDWQDRQRSMLLSRARRMFNEEFSP